MKRTRSHGDQARLIEALLDRQGRTFSGELGIDLAKNTPSALFQWLCAALLASARISSHVAMKAAAAIFANGWTTARKMAESRWEDRVGTLDRAGYVRYDESKARMLGDAAALLVEQYDGDLRGLRRRAARDVDSERRLLKAFKGIGDVGADIFLREVQLAWDEVYPFADRKALSAARTLGLPSTAEGLHKLVGRSDFVRVVAALVRTDLDDDYDEVRRAAGH